MVAAIAARLAARPRPLPRWPPPPRRTMVSAIAASLAARPGLFRGCGHILRDMAVTASTPIELVEEVYGRLPQRAEVARRRLGRPVTLAEKILFNHLADS